MDPGLQELTADGVDSRVHPTGALLAIAHGLFSTIDNRASAVVVMVGLRDLVSPTGDRASAAVLLWGR